MNTLQKQPEQQILVLQGGGALGAYQAGAYEALHENGYEPEWVAGISIGAINGALIAGNEGDMRVKRLREFWEGVSSNLQFTVPSFEPVGRSFVNEMQSNLAAMFGVAGFFQPRLPWQILAPQNAPENVSYYDIEPLRATLEKLIDFDYLNAQKGPRLSVGAVEITSGNFDYFDTAKSAFSPSHIMASGALPPGFPPVEVDEKFYWDGGLVSNTPLDYIVNQSAPKGDLCIFQVDVFPAKGALPQNIYQISERQKDIQYSSRTRLVSNQVAKNHALRHAARKLLNTLPETLANSAEAEHLKAISQEPDITIAHIIRRDEAYQTGKKDYEFSRQTVDEHWALGRKNVEQGLRSNTWQNRSKQESGFQVFDLTKATQDSNISQK